MGSSHSSFQSPHIVSSRWCSPVVFSPLYSPFPHLLSPHFYHQPSFSIKDQFPFVSAPSDDQPWPFPPQASPHLSMTLIMKYNIILYQFFPHFFFFFSFAYYYFFLI